MTECWMCYSDIPSERVDAGFDCHSECYDEFYRRVGNGLCARCGSNLKTVAKTCGSCGSGSEFKGYPGGSQ